MNNTMIKKAAIIVSLGMTLTLFQNCSKVNFTPTDANLSSKAAIAIDNQGDLVPVDVVDAVVPQTNNNTNTDIIKDTMNSTNNNTEYEDSKTENYESMYCHFEDMKHFDHDDHEEKSQGSSMSSKDHDKNDEILKAENEKDNGLHLGWYKKHHKHWKNCLKIKLSRHCHLDLNKFENLIDVADLDLNKISELNLLHGNSLLYSSFASDQIVDKLKVNMDIKHVALCNVKIHNIEKSSKTQIEQSKASSVKQSNCDKNKEKQVANNNEA